MSRFHTVVALALAIALSACANALDNPLDNPGPDAAPADRADAGPPPPDAGPPPPDAEPPLPPEAQALLTGINAARAAAGAGPLVIDNALLCAAERHSADIGVSRECSNTGSDGSSPFDRVTDCGGSGLKVEVLACGAPSADAVVVYWMQANEDMLLDSTYTTAGLAMNNSYWTLVFN